jgi:hypothetical protein
MITRKTLEKLKNAPADKSALVDIQSVKIDTAQPTAERLENYISQIHNPYVFKCGDTTIKFEYTNGGKTLEKALETYLINLKNK